MILGYGICGPNEKYLENTLMEFKRLCDKTIIVSNNSNQKDLIKRYGFDIVEDNREWGKFQNRIKEDFIKEYIPKIKPDACICLDMDEVIDDRFNKETVLDLVDKRVQAAYFFFINLWNDELHHNETLSFWNIRYWKYEPGMPLDVSPQPLHCGLYPKICWSLAMRVPYIVRHYGMMDKEARLKKVERYNKYDPKAQYKGRGYYNELARNYPGEVYDEYETKQKVEEYVIKYKQRIQPTPMIKEEKCFYVRNPRGSVVAIPERHLAETLKRKGFEFVGEAMVEGNSTVKIEAPTIQTNPLECAICGFVAKNEFGARSHARKHA